MFDWIKKLDYSDIYFVTPEVYRGTGIEDRLSRYHIICYYSNPLISILRRQGAKIFCLQEETDTGFPSANSGKLLEHPLVSRYIRKNSQDIPWIMYFKPSLKLDAVIKMKGYRKIGNNAELNEKYENKLNLAEIIPDSLQKFILPSFSGNLASFSFRQITETLRLPLIVQFGHGWAGKTTFTISSESEFIALREKFKETRVRISKFVKGFTVLNNACVYGQKIFISPPAYQINGITKLHENPAVTCGRQWPADRLERQNVQDISAITAVIGRIMTGSGYRGFFGLDFLIEESTGKLYLSEINARPTASSSFYTKLELANTEIPLMVYHIASFMNIRLPENYLIHNISGSQLTIRKNIPALDAIPSDYGVFNTDHYPDKPVRYDYFPGQLKENEFIFLRLTENLKKDIAAERFRIESKVKVLKSSGILADWLDKIVRGPVKT